MKKNVFILFIVFITALLIQMPIVHAVPVEGEYTDQNTSQDQQFPQLQDRQPHRQTQQSQDGQSQQPSQGTQAEIDDSFVSEAFRATGDFFKEDLPEDDVGIITDSMLYFIKRGIQAFNRILIVALAGIGAIAFALSGIKYFISVSDPKKLKEARDTLNITLRGLGFGFGAFIIWEVAMGVVNLIIDAMAK